MENVSGPSLKKINLQRKPEITFYHAKDKQVVDRQKVSRVRDNLQIILKNSPNLSTTLRVYH